MAVIATIATAVPMAIFVDNAIDEVVVVLTYQIDINYH
jgi:hypothetical protein